MHTKPINQDKIEKVPLVDAFRFVLEECRMVLPGIQGLFGFQLIAVFNDGFSEKLSAGEQALHLLALGLVAVAIALIMTPAAFHRHCGPNQVSDALVALSTRLVLWSMLPLSLGISLDFYLIARIVLQSPWVAILAGLLFLFFVLMWFALPRLARLRRPPSD
ncbi:DUF6328 family protein [Novimethylophilus kurashikiensis]|nr:DUF6328 family protein [Novimethylophilus kurashikiensis]